MFQKLLIIHNSLQLISNTFVHHQFHFKYSSHIIKNKHYLIQMLGHIVIIKKVVM